MTVTANRVTDSSVNVRISFYSGSLTSSIEENYSHLRGFHSDLGRLLDTIEIEAQTAG